MPVNGETDEPGWEVDPDDEWGVAVLATVGRQLKLRREALGLRAGDFGIAVGYGEDLVYKVEGGKRIPRREYLEKADQVLEAGGLLAATWEDVKKVRYPKQVRDLAKLESRAVESLSYGIHNVHGLLQTEEYADEFDNRPVTEPRHVRILELRYGIIRSEALTARESTAFIEKLLGET
ncbi:Scr1 family TA system antitoxin-like transcriptional regulator [Streptomyces sp. 049-1]|uniref:Scr1 family TA system antitoxin-like transcriptional regulator n=1 Tax=Streptomyces sp. 049-1 TaxID=2789264 RepID=UPI00397EF6D4